MFREAFWVNVDSTERFRDPLLGKHDSKKWIIIVFFVSAVSATTEKEAFKVDVETTSKLYAASRQLFTHLDALP